MNSASPTPQPSHDPEEPITRLQALMRAFRHRNYRLFFFGQLTSLIGTWMQTVAQAWLVYRLTDSTILLGLVSFCGQFPVFLLAPLAGAVADRHNRHRLLILTQITAMVVALALALLTLAGHIRVWEIFLLATMLGLVNAFDIPARQSFIVEMVGRKDLANAIALNSSMFNAARIVGPSIAGLMVAAVGEGWCFLVNSVSFLGVIVSLLLMRITPRVITGHRTPMPSHIREGLGFARRNLPICSMSRLRIGSLTGMPYVVLMPIFADRVLHGGAETLGVLMACTGVGALLGALTLAARRSLRGLSSLIGYAVLSFGSALILFSFSRSVWLSALLLVPVGFSVMVQMASSNTLLQMMVPDDFRGRVMSLYSMMFMGMGPLGALLAGTIAHHIGAPMTVAIGGVCCILAGLLFRTFLPAIRGEARKLVIAQQMAPGVPAQGTGGEPLKDR
ncbi:MAG TPA: MFS transporter [Gammaproteobacteria bacterium]|nr:MFS transporter [Gammaproteobacteria bacterium]